MGLASHGFAVRGDLIEERLCVNYARDLRFVPLDPICGEMQDFIQEFVEEWTVKIEDYTPRVNKIYGLLQSGHADKAKRQLPPEKPYPVCEELRRRLGMQSS